jgi:hypothetical protein
LAAIVGGVEAMLEDQLTTPESLLRFLNELRRYLCAPFTDLPHVSIDIDMHVLRATWKKCQNNGAEVAEALSSFLHITSSIALFNRWARAEGFSEITVYGGIDVGHLVISTGTKLGEVITSATYFAEEAVRKSAALLIAAEWYDRVDPTKKSSTLRKTLDVKAVVRRRREVVFLSLDDLRSLRSAS